MPIAGAFMLPHPPLIIPEVGCGKEGRIMDTVIAYRQAAKEIAELKPETIVIITPHSILYEDYFHISPGKGAAGDFSAFGAEQVKISTEYDMELLSELCYLCHEGNFMAGTMGEKEKTLDHGMMVPLYFINREYSGYKTVRVGLSGMGFSEHYQLGIYLKKAAENRRIVLVASGDLSHRLTKEGPYGFSKEGPAYDSRLTKAMGEGDFLDLFYFQPAFCEKAAECGHRSFLIMAGALDRTAVESKLLSYEGPYGVGYAVAAYRILGKQEERAFEEQYVGQCRKEAVERKQTEDEWVQLARLSLETYIVSGKYAGLPDNLPPELLQSKAGVFVSLKKQGKLRGCIGTIEPGKNSLAEEIMENAVSAAVRDMRFTPVTPEELEELVYSVDVLFAPERINSAEELDAKRYGVIVTRGRKRGLLLPGLEGIDTVEEQIAIAKQKAMIGQEEEVMLERFEVIRHG